jgi:tetratricopeptide (TPR) repeat protein
MFLAVTALWKLSKYQLSTWHSCDARLNTRRMKFPASPRKFFFPVVIIATAAATAGATEDASIDRLLKKLPAPEKLAKVQAATADPVIRDPIAEDIGKALSQRNSSRALTLSRRLTKRYPKSPLAHCIRGALASSVRRYPEASAAYRETIDIEPKFSFAYLQLGSLEAVQGHFAAAMPYFQKLVELEPKAPIGWVFLSDCSEKLGRQQESLQYAKRATVVAPSVAAAWLQLAHAENALGHTENARRANARAQKLLPRKQKG